MYSLLAVVELFWEEILASRVVRWADMSDSGLGCCCWVCWFVEGLVGLVGLEVVVEGVVDSVDSVVWSNIVPEFGFGVVVWRACVLLRWILVCNETGV